MRNFQRLFLLPKICHGHILRFFLHKVGMAMFPTVLKWKQKWWLRWKETDNDNGGDDDTGADDVTPDGDADADNGDDEDADEEEEEEDADDEDDEKHPDKDTG